MTDKAHEKWLTLVEAEMFDILERGGSIDELTNLAQTYLQNPLHLTNERSEIISKARGNAPYHEPLWEEIAEKGYVPREKRRTMSVERYAATLQNGKILIMDPDTVKHRIMLYQMEVSPSFYIRAALLESRRPFSEFDEVILQLYAQSAAYILSDSQLARSLSHDSLDFFLYELVLGRIDTKKSNADIISYLDLEPKARCAFLVVKNSWDNRKKVSFLEVRSTLQTILASSIGFIMDDMLVLLFSYYRQDSRLEESLSKAYSYLKNNNLHGCISRYFDNFENIADHFRLTRNTLDLGIRTTRNCGIVFVSDMMVNVLLDSFSQERKESLCYPPVLDLLKSDQQEGTEYLPALCAYTLMQGSCTQAAKLLGIHYNSMRTRLTYMERVVGTELSSILPALYLSLKILILTRSDYMSGCFEVFFRYRLLRGGRIRNER